MERAYPVAKRTCIKPPLLEMVLTVTNADLGGKFNTPFH